MTSRGVSPAAEAWRRFRQNRAATVGLGVVAALALFAVPRTARSPRGVRTRVTSRFRAMLSARRQARARRTGSGAIPFTATSSAASRTARVSLTVAVASTALATLIGVAVGVAAGWAAGSRFSAIDTALLRLIDVLLALPFLLFVTAIGAAVGRTDMGAMILVLGLVAWTGDRAGRAREDASRRGRSTS